jgi:hypothetical protein
MAESIVTQELAIRAAIEDIGTENTLLIKDNRVGRTYIELSIGTGLSLATRDGKLYIDSSGGGGIVPIYASHEAAIVELPAAGTVKEYYLANDYDFKYMVWSDGSRHNRRLPLSWETDE